MTFCYFLQSELHFLKEGKGVQERKCIHVDSTTRFIANANCFHFCSSLLLRLPPYVSHSAFPSSLTTSLPPPVDPPEMGPAWRQLKVMLRKNWLLKIRHPFITSAEVLLSLLFFFSFAVAS